jgi:hypothetical protein
VPRESDPKMTSLARTRSNCKRQTRPLVREGAPHQQTRNCLTVIKIWSYAPNGCFIARQTGWLTVGRNTQTQIQIWLAAMITSDSQAASDQTVTASDSTSCSNEWVASQLPTNKNMSTKAEESNCLEP